MSGDVIHVDFRNRQIVTDAAPGELLTDEFKRLDAETLIERSVIIVKAYKTAQLEKVTLGKPINSSIVERHNFIQEFLDQDEYKLLKDIVLKKSYNSDKGLDPGAA